MQVSVAGKVGDKDLRLGHGSGRLERVHRLDEGLVTFSILMQLATYSSKGIFGYFLALRVVGGGGNMPNELRLGVGGDLHCHGSE